MVSLVWSSNCLVNDSQLIFVMQAWFILKCYCVNSFLRWHVIWKEMWCQAASPMGGHVTAKPGTFPMWGPPSLWRHSMIPPKCLGSPPGFSSLSGLGFMTSPLQTFCLPSPICNKNNSCCLDYNSKKSGFIKRIKCLESGWSLGRSLEKMTGFNKRRVSDSFKNLPSDNSYGKIIHVLGYLSLVTMAFYQSCSVH